MVHLARSVRDGNTGFGNINTISNQLDFSFIIQVNYSQLVSASVSTRLKIFWFEIQVETS